MSTGGCCGGSGNGGSELKKPAIYLYPEKYMDISISLNLINSSFVCLYPEFTSENTWKVHAYPSGEIEIKNKKYPYLFWDADSYVTQNINKGFIVKSEEAQSFLEEKLRILGLNERESFDFITFWLPVLKRNKISLCSFQNAEFFDNFKLKIEPKPDSILRIFLTIKKIEKTVDIEEQTLKKFERKGFTVIEWGGSSI